MAVEALLRQTTKLSQFPDPKEKSGTVAGLVQSVLVEVAALVVACTMLARCLHGACISVAWVSGSFRTPTLAESSAGVAHPHWLNLQPVLPGPVAEIFPAHPVAGNFSCNPRSAGVQPPAVVGWLSFEQPLQCKCSTIKTDSRPMDASGTSYQFGSVARPLQHRCRTVAGPLQHQGVRVTRARVLCVPAHAYLSGAYQLPFQIADGRAPSNLGSWSSRCAILRSRGQRQTSGGKQSLRFKRDLAIRPSAPAPEISLV